MARYVDPARSGAVLIGVGSYIDPGLTDIAAVDANLTDLHRLVSDPSTGSFAGDKCVLVTAPERSRQVGDVVRRVARSTTDVLLVYYTGHGLIDRRGRLHLALAGSDPDRIGWTTLPLEALCEELLDSPAAIRILILDCCFTCPAAESMITVSAMVAEQVEVEGIYTVVSCVTDHSSFAPAGCRNTVMTAALLATLATTPELSLDELFAGLDGSLTRRAHPHPRRRGVDAVGELVLFSKPGPRYRDAATSDDIEATIELAGTHFDRGEYDQAEPWYRKAAEHGHPEAMKILGGLLEQRGEFTEAETWYRKAADAGDTEAITNLGWL
ncbi:caspase, EACC1-associated type, partial [Nocardia rhamnosiphila]